MEKIVFASAKYVVDNMTGSKSGIVVSMDGVSTNIPLDPANRHYAEIMRQVEAGELVIQEADAPE